MARWVGFGVGLAVAFGPSGVVAAGIDCSRARSPTERAICAAPGLRALDGAISAAYDDAVARAPERREALRSESLAWIKARDAACALPAAAVPRCLTQQMNARLAALAPPAAPAAAPLQLTAPPPSQLTAAAQRPADPAIPGGTQPMGMATLDEASLPAAEHAETLLRVSSPGRFTIVARSASGAALQLVDLVAGPGEVAGVAGAADGRLDPLLDVGTYKLRVASAAGAGGAVALSVRASRDAAPPAALPPPGFPLAAALADGEQRGFWFSVPADGAVRIEAAGRSLADLRLWRDGRELAALDPVLARVEPQTGRPLTDVRIAGTVEPGTYLAVAYGGPALPWTDNDAGQPFLLRAGASPALAEGWAGGPMGPFGSEVYAMPPFAGLVRLSLPAAAPAGLRVGDSAATIERNSREPTVALGADAKTAPVVEVTAAAGQAFTVQALETPQRTTVSGPGTFWVSAVANGGGGDEVPVGVLLERSRPANDAPAQIVASTVPQVRPGAGYRAQFNLRGPTSLLLQTLGGGPLTVGAQGAELVRPDPPGTFEVPAGFQRVDLSPKPGATGAVTLTVGPPGGSVAVAPALPRDPVLPLGIQRLDAGEMVRLQGPDAPGLSLGLSARAVPVALAEGPLVVTQAPGSVLEVPVAVAPGGSLAVSEVGGGPVAFGLREEGPGRATVVLPLPERPRSVVLAWRRPAVVSPIAPPSLPGARASLAPGVPAWLDLRAEETRGFTLTVPAGGLYRVETLGRLHTAGRVATAFAPRLNEAEANGAGQNMLLQQVLGAGPYRVDVTARGSAGHAGLLATPASILAGGMLVPGGTVRATLPAGSAASFPLQASGPGDRYRLEVATLGEPWTGRIEDAGGWPMAATDVLDGSAPVLPAGAYHLVVAPSAVQRQFVARLTAVVEPPEIVGHGPHPLPFEAEQAARWREPEGRNDARAPDQWVFTLAGPAALTLRLSDGMVGDLYRAGAAEAVGHFTGTAAIAAEAGRYRLDARSLGRNDRLDYTVRLASTEVQPGVARTLELPASLTFAVAEARVASLTTWGNVPVKAVLRRGDGSVVARGGARTDDWNVAVSRLLDAGRYTLELAAATPPGMSATGGGGRRAVSNEPPSEDGGRDAGGDAPEDAQSGQSAEAGGDVPETTGENGRQTGPSVAVTLALPEALAEAPAPAPETAVEGAGVHVFRLPPAPPGALVMAQAASVAPTVLSLERQAGDGWQPVAVEEGRGPLVAAVADGGAWRLQAWAVDGGAEPIRLAAQVVEAAAGPASLGVAPGFPGGVAVAHVRLDGAGPVTVAGPVGMRAGGWPGQALMAVEGPVLLQEAAVWLLAPVAGPVTVRPLPLTGAQVLLVPPGQAAQLPAVDAGPGRVALWRAEGGFGQPALGPAAGIAGTSVVALADVPLALRRGAGAGPLRVELSRIELPVLPGQPVDGALQATVPAGSALPLTLPGGDKVIEVGAGAGVAVFAKGAAAWAGDAPMSRTLAGAWTEVLLVNAGSAAAPASVRWQPAGAAAALRPGGLAKRFYGAAGSFELPFDAGAGGRLGVAGEAVPTAVSGDGAVSRGAGAAVAGPGRVVVEHGVGPVAVWLESPTASPWPGPAAAALELPGRAALGGEAMAFAFDLAEASLVHVTTTAPVFAALGGGAPRLFAAGAELASVLPAGRAELRLFSPGDGPLTGAAMVSADPIMAVGEGVGAPVVVAPGQAAAWRFTLPRAATIGVGVRAEPDRATVRLLDAAGAVLGEGVAQQRALPAGRYVIEARAPADGSPTSLRAAVVGVTRPGSGPPPEVVRTYLELVGLAPTGGGR